MEQEAMPHSLQLSQRQKLSITGVSEVISFDENAVVLRTELGTLVIQGQQLQLKNLSEAGGEVRVEGSVSSLNYEEPRSPGSWRQRLFG